MIKKLRDSWIQKSLEAKIRFIASIIAMIILCIFETKIGVILVLLTIITKVATFMINRIFKDK